MTTRPLTPRMKAVLLAIYRGEKLPKRCGMALRGLRVRELVGYDPVLGWLVTRAGGDAARLLEMDN